ncbi:hypothetical protein QYF36_000922 [Acer negundo]|nr:hypothetical protein QYF36_000922 [Acer negundo]
MGASKKKVTIAHRGDDATFINIVHIYRCSCGHSRGAYCNARQLLPQNQEAKFRELRRFINEVIPTYKFEKNVRAFVCDWIVSHATALESDLLIRYLREDDHTCSICLGEFEDGKATALLIYTSPPSRSSNLKRPNSED